MDEAKFRPEVTIRTERNGLLQNVPVAGSAEEGAAIGLMVLMSGISEQSFAAGWAVNLEYELWQCAQGEPSWNDRLPEDRRIAARQCTLLRLLSDECDGWWMSPPDEPGSPLRFVSLTNWKRHIAHFWVHRLGFVSRGLYDPPPPLP